MFYTEKVYLLNKSVLKICLSSVDNSIFQSVERVKDVCKSFLLTWWALQSDNIMVFVFTSVLWFVDQFYTYVCPCPSSPGSNSFVGHGAGARFLDSQSVLKRRMRAASLLFGCSSAALAVRGDQEGQGIILNYLIAGWWESQLFTFKQ